MGKEKLERIPDEQIEAVSGAGEKYSKRDAWLLCQCPFCGYIDNHLKAMQFSMEDLYDDYMCQQCKKVYNIRDCVEEYKKGGSVTKITK